jgi:hypothetical protein
MLMLTSRPPELQAELDRLYALYAEKPAGDQWCDFCWDSAEIEHVTTTPVREISPDMARKLLWETADHFENVEVYKHYLPRILDALAPPDSTDDLFPLHLFEVLKAMHFHAWALEEQRSVLCFLENVTPLLPFDLDEDVREWNAGLAFIRDGTPLPHSG